jgi:hypothetical protein
VAAKARPHTRKRYFKVAEKVLNREWSNDELAGLIRLMAYLNARWSSERIDDDEAGYAEICRSDVMKITGKRRADVAAKSLEHLANIASMSVQHRGDVAVILWPKFSEFQGYGRQRAASESESESDTECVEKARVKRAPRTPKDALTEEQIQKLIAMKPGGITYEPSEVEAWWLVVRPKMLALGRKKLFRSAVNWWPRVTGDEIRRACESRDMQSMEAHRKQVEAAPPSEPDLDLEFEFGVIGPGGGHASTA